MQSILVACPGSGAIREAMDRDSRKRGRDAASAEMPKKKKGKGMEPAAMADFGGFEPCDESGCRVEIIDVTDVFRPPGLFEFPWQKEGRLLVARESERDQEWEWDDLRDVFFSSLVDGCSAAIEVPGDRLSPGTAARGSFFLPEEPTEGGADCVWSSVLRQPLSTVFNSKNCNA